MPLPRLYIFTISHFCEKSRWALDYLGIEREDVHLGPGLHMLLSRKHGLIRSSLPVLESGNQVIQGSAEIADWADSNATNGRQLTFPETDSESRAIEQRLDDGGRCQDSCRLISLKPLPPTAAVPPVSCS